MMYVAKPNMLSPKGKKAFKTQEQAVKYLEEVTGYQMSFEVVEESGIKKRVYDWEVIGKLYPISTDRYLSGNY